MFKCATRVIIIVKNKSNTKRTLLVVGRYHSSIISPKSNSSKCPFLSGSANKHKGAATCPRIVHYSQDPTLSESSSANVTSHPLCPKRDGLDSIETTDWRYPEGPYDYTKVNATYLKERIASWNDPNCLENVVSNVVKTLEMEVTNKINPNQFVSIVPELFRYKANDGCWVEIDSALTRGLYNVVLDNSPKHLYDANQTFDQSHELFHNTFTKGFIWEVLKVYSGPPNVAFTWRHWGVFDGIYNQNPGNGNVINVYGFCTAKVKLPGDDTNSGAKDDPYVRVEEFQVWYDAEKFLSELNGIDNKSVVDTVFGIEL